MGINVTHTMSGFQFENRENLKNAAKDILSRQGANKESIDRITGKSIFGTDAFYTSAQASVIKASAQMSISNKLSETLKYLRKHSGTKSVKSPVFGELWASIDNKTEDNQADFDEIVVDFSRENIFEAA